MVRFSVLGLLAVCFLFGVFGAVVGCGARAEVAKDKMLAKLDSVLGELDVKRKKIEKKQKSVANQLEQLRAQRIESQVRLEKLQEKKTSAQAKMSEIEGKLVKVRALVEEAKAADGKLERNGKTYTTDDIMASADKVMSAFSSEQTRMAGIDKSIVTLQGVFDFLSAQEKTANRITTELSLKVDEIDAKKAAVDVVRKAQSIAGDNQSINDDLAALEKEIEELSIDVETALLVEQEKMSEFDSANSDADELLNEKPSLDSIGAEIDALLGDKK